MQWASKLFTVTVLVHRKMKNKGTAVNTACSGVIVALAAGTCTSDPDSEADGDDTQTSFPTFFSFHSSIKD
jgi:hypothetical protein